MDVAGIVALGAVGVLAIVWRVVVAAQRRRSDATAGELGGRIAVATACFEGTMRATWPRHWGKVLPYYGSPCPVRLRLLGLFPDDD